MKDGRKVKYKKKKEGKRIIKYMFTYLDHCDAIAHNESFYELLGNNKRSR